jgi:hypothetical protein
MLLSRSQFEVPVVVSGSHERLVYPYHVQFLSEDSLGATFELGVLQSVRRDVDVEALVEFGF